MNPRLGVFLSSLIVTAVIAVIAYFLFPQANPEHLLILALVVCLVSAAAIYFFARVYLSERLLPIYRTLLGKNSDKLANAISTLDAPVDQAEQEVTDWADQRIQEIKDLQAKDDFRKEFIGNLAHELKTPLFNIQGYVNSLLEGAMEDEKVRERFLNKANRNIDRMTRIVEDLDTITRLEHGRIDLDIKAMDIRKCSKDVVDSLEEIAEQRSTQVQVDKGDELMVMGDEFRVGQVIENLVSNAIMYGKESGEVHVKFSRLGDHVLVEVSDNGPGMDPEVMPRIFERFYRVDKSRSRNIAGSGLGLAIVKHIVESHGQTIHAHSEKGMGSSFSFTLALAK